MTHAEEMAYKRRWIALLILSLSLVIVVADSTIVNIAFPALRKTFGATYADAEWINSIYSLVFGAALITWGKLGDQFGRRNIFIAGAITFLIGSAGTGFAGSLGAAIFFRAVQGMGGAMMSPSTLSIISATFKGKERGAAFGVWGASAGVAAAIGPILGGWLITHGQGLADASAFVFNALGVSTDSWRLAFLINVPVGLFAIVGSIWAIREKRNPAAKHKIDVLGIVLASASLGLIVFGAIEGQNYGWLQAKAVFKLGSIVYPQLADGVTKVPAGTASFIPFLFAIGVIFFALFVVWELWQERHDGEPLFEFGMLRYPSFRYGLFTIMIVALGEFGIVLGLSLFFQLAKGLDAFQTGLTFLPFAVVTLIAAPMAGVLSGRIGSKWVVTTGMALEAIALFLISQTMYADATWQLFPPLIIYGAGVGLAIAQLANITLGDVPPQKAGVGSGATNTIRQLGSSLGIAIIGAILFGTFASDGKVLIDERVPKAFAQFGTDVANATNIAPISKTFGKQLVGFADTTRQAIDDGLDSNNSDFSTNTDFIQSAIDKIPASARPFLKLAGIDLTNQVTVDQLKTDLDPLSAPITDAIHSSLADGLSTGGRTASLVAMVFVMLGALSSLALPNNKTPATGAPSAGH
jgi:MFS family permease